MNKVYESAFKSTLKKATQLIKNKSRITNLLVDASKKITLNKSSLLNIKDDLLILIKLISSWVKGDYKNISNTTIATVIATILYFVNPIDIIPDFTPLIGYTDDATILLYVLSKLSDELEEFKKWNKLN
ncbi:MAG: DUF1232 domain-containing protein [Ichthyobacteriaceae bacterium]|nr:DUF1232 domain-containing protein [Ichthyobacteriaceae bacterium]